MCSDLGFCNKSFQLTQLVGGVIRIRTLFFSVFFFVFFFFFSLNGNRDAAPKITIMLPRSEYKPAVVGDARQKGSDNHQDLWRQNSWRGMGDTNVTLLIYQALISMIQLTRGISVDGIRSGSEVVCFEQILKRIGNKQLKTLNKFKKKQQ